MINKCRQGDLWIKSVEKILNGLNKIKTNVLAHGESGHKHQFETNQIQIYSSDDQIYDARQPSETRQLFVEIVEPSKLVHEEHNPIELKPGFYQIIQQRDFDPYSEAVRRVQD